MTTTDVLSVLEDALDDGDGILELDPALVARDWLPPGRRLGLAEDEYDVGERGFICERWLASTTHADNVVGPPDEGISHIRLRDGRRLALEAAVRAAPADILGTAYAATHDGLGRLAKIFDFAARIPYHIHPPTEFAELVGRRSKDEAYYLPPGIDMGPRPETFLGTHPSLADGSGRPVFLQYLRAWDSDEILKHAPAYLQVAEEGFFVPSGILHAPGTALTIELQEDSDTLSMFQALNAGAVISKNLLFKDVATAERDLRGEDAVLDWVDWPANADPFFYENHHLTPRVFHDAGGVTEAWILYGSSKFSGKRLVIAPGARHVARERGVFNLLAWQGRGTVGGSAVAGGQVGADELLVVHDRAVQPLEYVNTGEDDLVIIKFFGPDINPDAPHVTEVGRA
jgi:hypothetical protein